MKPIYAVGGAVALALVMLAGWLIIRSNIQTTGLIEAPQVPAVNLPESPVEPQPEAVEAQDMAALNENLVAAVKDGDAAEVERLLNSGADPDFVGSKGAVALPMAAGAGDLEIVRLLLAAGADVNSGMDVRITTGHSFLEASPLFHAAAAGHLEVVELLLASGADPNQPDTAVGVVPLHEAARMNYLEIVQALLANGADVNLRGTRGDTPLYWAALVGSVESSQALLEAGADANIQELEEGLTPLMASLIHQPIGPPELITLLLDHGTNLDTQNNVGNTALHFAAFNGDGAVVEILLSNGASIDLQNNGGMTPLHRAAVGNRIEAVKVLIEYGASLEIKDNEGQTALDVAFGESQDLLREAGAVQGSPAETSAVNEELIAAVDTGDPAEVERLLEEGANPNFANGEGNMPLALAAEMGTRDIAQLLLEAGADVNSTATKHYPAGQMLINAPAIAHAAYQRDIEMVALLIENGADVNRPQSNSLETALHNAVWRSSPEIVKLLLDNGADPDLPANNSWFPEGSTALLYAIGNGSVSSAEALLEGGADPNIIIGQGQTPLLFTIQQQFSTSQMTIFVTALLKGGADPNIQDPNGDAALHYAIMFSQTDLIPLLIENGAAIDQQNGEGDTALHIAARFNRPEALSILLEQGASANIENNEGQTELDVATGESLELLREEGAQ
jgi:ankyrin repeat protein